MPQQKLREITGGEVFHDGLARPTTHPTGSAGRRGDADTKPGPARHYRRRAAARM